MLKDRVEKMDEGKGKELMKILSEDARPFMRKCDGYAVEIKEDKEITYKDGDQELTLKVPSGSVLTVRLDGCYPEIETSESFDKKNKFIGEKKEEQKESKKQEAPEIGISLMSKENY